MYNAPMFDKNDGEKTPQNPFGDSKFWTNVFVSFSLLILIGGAYSFFTSKTKITGEISLSQFAQMVTTGEVTKVTVEGDTLSIDKKDGTKLLSKKEGETSLTETLKNYGVEAAKISQLQIDVKSDSAIFWLNVLPFVMPILFLVIFIWFISRQVKGAGMQAFTFGQSKRVSLTQMTNIKK